MATSSVRQQLHRVRANLQLPVQAGCAAGLAWFVAHDLIGHRTPFFAPVAAVVALGAALGQRIRRVIELTAGVAVGVLVGDTLIYFIGTGPLQLALVVALAVLVALFVRGGNVTIAQSASSAVLIATLQPPSTGIAYPRFLDATVGGAVGIVVTALVPPPNPLLAAQHAAEPVLATIADGFESVAAALNVRDREAAREVLERLRDASRDLARYDEALAASREAARLSPLWWRLREHLGRYTQTAPDLDLLTRNARVLARRAVALLRDNEPVPTQLLDALDALGAAVRALGRDLHAGREPVQTRELAARAVRYASAAHDATLGFSGAMVVGQVRFSATDLIRASGLDRPAAEGLVRAAVRSSGPPGPAGDPAA